MTDFPDDIYAPTSMAQPAADADRVQVEAAPPVPLDGLTRMSRRLGARIRKRQGTVGGYLRLMD